MGQLTKQIKVVAGAREVSRRAIDIKKALLAEWESLNRELLEDIVANAQVLTEAEDALHNLTLKAYAETGDKAPAPGVGIRVVTVLDYDPKVALDWAKHHEMALKLDTKAFEKIVKADTPGFVKVTTEPLATIATDLSEYLK